MKILLPLLVLLLVITGRAQTPDSSDPAAAQARTFRLVSMDEVYSDLRYDLHGVGTPVFASSGGLSRPYATPAGGVLKLYREIPPPEGAPAGTKPTRQTVAEIPTPAAQRQNIVLLAAAPAGSALPVTGVTIEDSPKEHTVGTIRVFNHSSLPAAFGLDSKIYQVAAHDSIIIPFVPDQPANLNLAVRVKSGGNWMPSLGAERRLSANVRVYCFVFDGKPNTEYDPPARSILLLDYVRTPPATH